MLASDVGGIPEVVADGGLVELGTHADLVATGGRYAQLYRSWVGGLASA